MSITAEGDKKDHSSNRTPLLCLFAGNDFLVSKLQLHAASANWKMLSSITFCLSFVSFFLSFQLKAFWCFGPTVCAVLGSR